MAPTGALRNLTLALEAAVVVLGSLLFIAWKLYFRGSEPAGTWDDWWERELRELQERDPAGSAVRAAGAAAVGLSFAGIPTGMGKKLGSGWGLLPRGAEAVGSEVPPSPPRPEPTQLQKGVWDGSIDGTPPALPVERGGLASGTPPSLGKDVWGLGAGGTLRFSPAPGQPRSVLLPAGGVEAGAGAGAGRRREEQRPALHLQPEGQDAHPAHAGLQFCPAARRGAGDGPAGG